MAKRRSNNEGTIYKKKDGKWRAQLSLNGRRLSQTTHSQSEAQEWMRVTRNKIAGSFNFDGGQTTLQKFLEGWFVSIQSSRKPETVDLYERILRRNVVPVLGNIKLAELRPDHIQGLYIALKQEGKSQHAVHSVHKILHTALEQAVKLKILPGNPCKATEAPSRVHKEMAFLNEEQVQTLLLTASMMEDRYLPIYYLAIHTGMRQAELLALKWEDISWERKTLNVNRQLIRKKGGGYIFRPPKTQSGRRQIALGQASILVLKDHRTTQSKLRQEMGDGWTELDLVFPSNIGTPIVGSNLRKDFRKAIELAGLPRLRFHDLRHTAASLMLNYGVPVIVVSKRLGHANASITLNVYGHLIPSMQEKAAEVMDELLTPASFPIAPKLHPND